MKFLSKKIYFFLILTIIFFNTSKIFAKSSQIQYTSENISNYFLGIVSVDKNYNDKAFDYLKKVKSLKDTHSKFNIEFIRTLVLIDKFNKATNFSKNVSSNEAFLFEADLLVGLDYFKKKDYKKAEKYFEKLNKVSESNIFFQDFIGNILIAWSKAAQNNKEGSFRFIEKIPRTYSHLKEAQSIFLQCHFDDKGITNLYKKLLQQKKYNFSRYYFFLANYLLFNNEIEEAKKIIDYARIKHNSNLLLKQTESFLRNGENSKIKNFFDCKKPGDAIAEFFYVISNLYSSEKEFQLSNFYLKLAMNLNNRFLANKALLAENYYYQKKNLLSKKAYQSLKSIGNVYSWYAEKSIAVILEDEKGKEYSVEALEDKFNSLSNPNYEHYYDLANFYKNRNFYEKSIKYYSLALENLKKDHYLVPKILDRRGTSYERIGEWKKAEKDLLESLKIIPDQPHVLNYLAYSWIEQGINLDKALVMLKKATELKENDGYIIDSLGWAYYAKKNYTQAEYFLQRAVELLPQDPVINDHYADTLWMLNKYIQARYFWSYILELNDTEQELKDIISKKLIFGINKKL